MSGPDQTPQKPDDRELEDFLAGRGPLRETYRAASQEKSPSALDDAILKIAADTLSESAVPLVVRKRSIRRWTGSFAAAAVLVLSLSVFMQIHRDPVAQKAVFAPMVSEVAQVPAAPAVEQMKEEKARVTLEQSKLSRNEMKQKSSEGVALGALHAVPPMAKKSAPLVAQPAQEGDMVPLIKDEAETRSDIMRDAPKPAPPAAMASKSMRPGYADRMMESAAPAAPAPVPVIEAAPSTDQEIDRWLKTCASDTEMAILSRDDHGMFKATQQWRGLAVTGFANGALLFAPDVSREAVTAKLNPADSRQEQCLVTGPAGKNLQLRCGCLKL